MSNDNPHQSVVWVDDDIHRALSGLGRLLTRRRLSIIDFTNAEQATQYLTREHDIDGCSHLALLVDVIIPKSAHGNALSPYAGLDLAEKAASLGVKKICFLTVMDQEEVLERYKETRVRYPNTQFKFTRKMDLISTDVLDKVVKFLRKGD